VSARLPSEVTELIRRVLRSAELPRNAAREVERDLHAHFEDGLAAGCSTPELIARFGDPSEAGRRIAEARRRGGKGIEAHEATASASLTPAAIAREGARAIRSLLASPLFSLTAVATLALGVGANTAVFTVLDSVLLEPLPYPDAERLVRVYETSTEDGGSEYLRGMGVLEYRKWEEVFESFGVLYTYRESGADLTEGDVPERVVVSRVDAGFFQVMGAAPLLGRTFLPEESLNPAGQTPDRARSSGEVTRVTVLSERLWRQRFDADPGILGRQIRLDGVAFEVVGVLAAGFTMPFGSTPDLWVPQDLAPGGSNSWGNHYLSGVAKLREGVTPEAAQARVDALNAAMVEQIPDADEWSPQLVPLREALVGDSRRTMLLVLAGAVGLVLLSACVNVSNLVFARNLGRARDIAVRSALGAGRPGLVLHLLSESVVLAGVGAAAGIAVGWLGVRGLLALAPDALPALLAPELSARVFVIGLIATTTALLLFGLVPALRFSAAAPADAMRQGGRTGTESRRAQRVRSALVVVQVAAALVLLVGAGLLMRSFTALRQVELGADPDGVLTFEVNLPVTRYPDGASRHRLHEALERRIAELPGVTAAGATSWLPLNGRYHTWGLSTEPANLDNDAAWTPADVRMVAGDYFDAVGIEVLRGERLENLDAAGPPVVWVSRALAEQAFGDADPVGRTLQAANEPRRVAGVVEDVRHDPREGAVPTVYVPHAHYADNRNWALVHAVRAGGDLGVLEGRIRQELSEIDPSLILYRPRPLEAFLAARRAQDRFATALMGAFAALALTLTAVGTYGVLASLVERKRREIGIRMALGARTASVRAMILRSALALCVLGSGLGLVTAFLGARALRSLLFEVEPADPVVFAGAAVLLLGLSALAAWLPARRATRLDPASTLGSE
jgi:predicted permease